MILTKNKTPPTRIRCQCKTMHEQQCQNHGNEYRNTRDGRAIPVCSLHGRAQIVRHYTERAIWQKPNK
jgi:hypothetical protein